VDGNEFIDYVGSWGPMILGHRDDRVLRAIHDAAERGWSYGAPTEAETELARMVCRIVPSVEMVRMVNSGTEATLSALRLARAWTGRDRIVKFSGCYHGHHDALLVAAGSGLATFGTPSSPGVTASTTADTVVCRFNDLDSVDEAFRTHGDQVACIVVEPVAGNMGVVAPAPGFLEGLRQRCDDNGALLVFDEVMTGFRVARGGAQERYGVTPDLTTMGKVIGGGLPVGAYGGRADIMRRIAPEGDVYQAGTLSGNPLAMAAGLVTLTALETTDAYTVLEARAAAIEDGLAPVRERYAGRLQFARVGSMFTLFFAHGPVRNFDDASSCHVEHHANWFHALLDRGVYMPPSQFEACFVSLAHSEDDVGRTVTAMSDALEEVLGG
jgi:glutamate-1-semialdehyde 2,1-aminomutase